MAGLEVHQRIGAGCILRHGKAVDVVDPRLIGRGCSMGKGFGVADAFGINDIENQRIVVTPAGPGKGHGPATKKEGPYVDVVQLAVRQEGAFGAVKTIDMQARLLVGAKDQALGWIVRVHPDRGIVGIAGNAGSFSGCGNRNRHRLGRKRLGHEG